MTETTTVAIPAFLPFYRHVVSPAAVAAALRPTAVPVTVPERLAELLDDVHATLQQAVEGQSFRTLIRAFHSFRAGQGLPAAKEGDRALRRFTHHLEDPAACERILADHPVLDERLDAFVRGSLAAYAEVLQHYADDLPRLRAAALVGPDASGARITALSAAGSDLHNGYRQVVGVRLADGTRLVHKPRPLVSDDFVRDLYAAAEPYLTHSLRRCVPPSLSADGHGWQGFVAHRPMDAPEQTGRYYYRFGALCAVFGAIGACDLHHENVLAHGEHPCLIDTETVLRPEVGERGTALPLTLMHHLQLSVATTMLVPMVNPASPVDVLMAGVGVAGEQRSDLKGATVRDPGCDAISVGWETGAYRHDGNLPHLGDVPLKATDHYADIVAGYTDALSFVRSRDVLRVLDAHADLPVRCLIRSTMVYARFLDAATHPDYLADRAESDRLLRLLAGFPAYLSEEGAHRLGLAEHACLATGNVPYFSTRGDSREITAIGAGPLAVVTGTPLEFARAGVAVNAARGDLHHRFLLEETFGELADEGGPQGLSAQSVFRRSHLAAAPGAWWPAIARLIRDVGVSTEGPKGTETGWLCGVGPGRATPTLAPGTFVSFHDSGGIVSFLERAARYDVELTDAHWSAERGLDALLSVYGDALADTADSVFSGTASLLLARPGRPAPDWLEDLLGTVGERIADGSAGGDLASGPAGLLMVLLSRAERGDRSLLPVDAPLTTLVDAVRAALDAPRAADWSDVAHGELGLRWALSRAGRVLGDAALVRASADWLADRTAHGAAPTGTGWCKGAAGLLLASAEILVSAGRQEALHDGWHAELLAAAVRLPERGPVDLSVCHGSSGVVQSLIATGRLLGERSLLERADDFQQRVLDRIRTAGFSTGAPGRTSLLGYLLGWAGIGDSDLLLHAGRTGRDGVPTVPVALEAG